MEILVLFGFFGGFCCWFWGFFLQKGNRYDSITLHNTVPCSFWNFQVLCRWVELTTLVLLCRLHLVMCRDRSFRNQNTKEKSAQSRSVEEREGGNRDHDLSPTSVLLRNAYSQIQDNEASSRGKQAIPFKWSTDYLPKGWRRKITFIF